MGPAHGQQITWAKLIHHTGHATVLVKVPPQFAVEVGRVSTGAQHRDQVAPCRGSSHPDAISVELVLLRVCFQPTDGRFAVMDLGGPYGFARQAISNGKQDLRRQTQKPGFFIDVY